MGRPKLSPRQQEYIENRARGLDRQQSAVLAGYADHNDAGGQVEESTDVQQELARIRAETAKDAGITKDMVAGGLKRAADMAQTMADPVGMVAAWRELGKLLGFYAPAVKKIEKGINRKDLLAAMDQLSDEELLQLSRGKVIDGEFKRLPDQPATDVPLLPEK